MASKFYHASPHRLKYHTILIPQGRSRNFESSENKVYLTTSPKPHYTLWPTIRTKAWHIYQVLPLSDIYYGRMWDEIMVDKAIVIRYICKSTASLNDCSKVRYSDINPPKGIKVRGRGDSFLTALPNIDLSRIPEPLHSPSKSNRYLRKKARSKKKSEESHIYEMNLKYRDNPYYLNNKGYPIL